jgi:hypothetical protein
MYILYSVLAILILVLFVIPFRTFYIFKGFHFCLPHMFRIFFGSTFEWEFSFDQSCTYEIGSDETDANKLCGISYNVNPHIDSARFGWEWNPTENKIDIDAYTYVDGVRGNVIMASVPLNEVVNGSIVISSNGYTLILQSPSIGTVTKAITKTKNSTIKFLLDPYFGGTQTAPHLVKIYLKRLNF